MDLQPAVRIVSIANLLLHSLTTIARTCCASHTVGSPHESKKGNRHWYCSSQNTDRATTAALNRLQLLFQLSSLLLSLPWSSTKGCPGVVSHPLTTF